MPRRLHSLALLLPLALAVAGCAGDPIRDIETRRAKYEATLSGFVVQEVPGAATPRIVLDVLVRGDARPPLSGITVEVSMAGADGKEKLKRQAWLELGAGAASGEQRTIVFDDVAYAAGDGFFVEIRRGIAEAERAAYREFGAPR